MDNRQYESTKRLMSLGIALYNGFMITYTLLPRAIVIIFSLIFVFWLFRMSRKTFTVEESLFLASVGMLPVSFVSVLGTSYAKMPLTWFNLLVILLFLFIMLRKKLCARYFLLIFIFLMYALINCMQTTYVIDSLKQTFTIVLFLLCFPIGKYFYKYHTEMLGDMTVDILLSTTIGLALQIFIQRGFSIFLGRTLGHYATMGLGRKAYGGLMGDWSFATLFLAIGCMIALIKFIENKNISFIAFLGTEGFLVLAILVVTSRTGFAALGIVCVLYFIRNIHELSFRKVIVLFGGIIAIPAVINSLIVSRAGQSLLDGSGRVINYGKAFELISKKPFFGYGLGLSNMGEATSLGVPHNFFIQYLLQIGIVGTFIILAFFAMYLIYEYNKKNPYRWLFWLVAVGSMFIPDIASSRFYFAVMILTMIPISKTSPKLMEEHR